LSQRLKYSSLLDETDASRREPSGEVERTDSRSLGKNLSHTTSDMAADLNMGETAESRATSRGAVKDSAFAMHPSGSSFKCNSPDLSIFVSKNQILSARCKYILEWKVSVRHSGAVSPNFIIICFANYYFFIIILISRCQK